MIDFANENPSRLAEMLRRNPKMVENAIKIISKDPEMMEFATRAYQEEFQKHQSGELVRREGSKPGEQLLGKLVRRDTNDQDLQNQIEILRDRIDTLTGSNNQTFKVAMAALTLGIVLAGPVVAQVYIDRMSSRAIRRLTQDVPLQPVQPAGPAQNV